MLRRMCEELRQALDDIEGGARIADDGATGPDEKTRKRTPSVYEMIQQLSAAQPVGFPRNSMGGRGAKTSFDGKGEPMPLISDPVGELVASPGLVFDPMHKHTQSVVQAIRNATGDLRAARASMIKASVYADLKPAEPGCSNCARVGDWTPIYRGERCRWCYDFWTAEGVDAPSVLLQARSEGRKITEFMIKESLIPQAKRKATRKPKGKKKRRGARKALAPEMHDADHGNA